MRGGKRLPSAPDVITNYNREGGSPHPPRCASQSFSRLMTIRAARRDYRHPLNTISYKSEYFLLLPFAKSTGYLLSFSFILRAKAALISIPASWAIRSTQ